MTKYDSNPKLVMPTGHMMTTSGCLINLFNPDPELIFLDDIAHGLAQTCRWNGHTKSYYSVAEHTIQVVRRVPNDRKLTALFHDAEEAYWGDIISPLKAILPNEIIQAMVRFRKVIFDKYNVPDIDDVVDYADKIEMEWDFENIVSNDRHRGMLPMNAKMLWLSLASQLLNK